MAEEIRWAFQNADMDKIDELLKKGLDPNKPLGSNGRRPIHVASDYGHLNVIQKLVESGADVNVKDTNGIEPLFDTICEGHVSCAKFLLEKGANANGTGPDGSPYITSADNSEIKELLKSHGAK
ncbi:predicted protein [Nematostella vectensis]|uniref:Myotrophin n=1 Tax=Nematostella vectensis TaxID=45351 RepID=A7RZH7_NEMVE|nr:myotrophin [Nematostella vectensis]EDO43094.1 predicted protein [Nematostella vectensis]|eukprot:XP_001635157.1 predicted protein [Nematostella vectensis]